MSLDGGRSIKDKNLSFTVNRSKTRLVEICRSPEGDKTIFAQFGSELWDTEEHIRRTPFLWIRWILWRIREEDVSSADE